MMVLTLVFLTLGVTLSAADLPATLTIPLFGPCVSGHEAITVAKDKHNGAIRYSAKKSAHGVAATSRFTARVTAHSLHAVGHGIKVSAQYFYIDRVAVNLGRASKRTAKAAYGGVQKLAYWIW